ncbi:MAG TPA: shikimate dehydrogenase [Lysobacter sp.]|nr:shikimate dehydrogenase [Lysobacter sp.]
MPDRYAVIGHPVAHSKSPWIHAQFARTTGEDIAYDAIDAPPAGFVAAVEKFRAAGGKGLNVTLPFKEEAFRYCSGTSARAAAARAVNTLLLDRAQPFGDNTDGVGLVRDLTERQGLDLRARRTLLIGAGGAARGVAPALLDAGIGDLYIVNRTPERADALADALAQPGRVHPRYFNDVGTLGNFDLVINATSAARDGAFPSFPVNLVAPRGAAVDLSYGEAAVPFLAWARSARAHDCIDGLGMLVEQAAESFQRWHKVRPETDSVYAMLRDRDTVLVTAD